MVAQIHWKQCSVHRLDPNPFWSTTDPIDNRLLCVKKIIWKGNKWTDCRDLKTHFFLKEEYYSIIYLTTTTSSVRQWSFSFVNCYWKNVPEQLKEYLTEMEMFFCLP